MIPRIGAPIIPADVPRVDQRGRAVAVREPNIVGCSSLSNDASNEKASYSGNRSRMSSMAPKVSTITQAMQVS